MNRIIAILDFDKKQDNVKDLIVKLAGKSDELYVFTPAADTVVDTAKVIVVPAEMDTQPKFRNYINRFFKDMGFKGFLHVVSTGVDVFKDPAPFMADLENAMRVLDYGVWFNTVCDGCNYVYSRYNSRMHINMDMPEITEKTGLSGILHFTSHSNAQWIVYDFTQATDDQLRFDEDFKIPMFWIIEYLARRRNTSRADQLFFMNQYLTVASELGVFGNRVQTTAEQESAADMQREDALFKSKNINYAQDGNIDEVLEKFLKKVYEKAGLTV